MVHRKRSICASAGALLAGAVQAQVTLDGTLGPAGTLPGPDYQIGADLGRQVGGNLFHSFDQFSIHTGESATFSGPNSVTNIIGRVTGGNESLIDGTLRSTIPGANLYLLNPAGVLFGEHAQLDVPGSVHVSTADYLRLSDGGRFDARTPANSVLTAAPVAAFGFMDGTPGRITVEGAFLQVPDGQTLSLIGGDITLTNATLYAPAGRINLASVGSAGEVIPTDTDLTMQGFGRLGTLTMERDPTVERIKVDRGESLGERPLGDLDTSGEGGGAIFIRGGQWFNQGGEVYANTYGARSGQDINILVTDTLTLQGGGLIIADTYGEGDAGSVTISARNLLVDEQGSGFLTGIVSHALPGSRGAGGDVHLTVAETLSLRNGSVIITDTYGEGDAGSVIISARNLLIDGQGSRYGNFTGISSAAQFGSSGGGGDVHLTVAETLSLFNYSYISTGTFGEGDAGSVTISARNLLMSGQGSGFYAGIASAGIASGTQPGSKGAGGDVHLTVTETLSVLNGGAITADTFGEGDAGSVTINAHNLIVDGQGSEFFTGISTSAKPGSIGAGGNVVLDVAESLSVFNGGVISVASFGAGNTGDLTITTPYLTLANGSSIFAASLQTTGGNILINADHLKLLDGSQINASVFGDERTTGGNVTINSTNVVALNGSRITAQATQGKGGNILVNAEVFLHDAARADDVLNASSEVLGNDGMVQNNAPTTDISGSLAALPARYLNAADRLSHRCGVGDRDTRSRFTVQGRGALPPGPDEPATTPATGCRSEPLALARATPPASVITATPVTATSGFGDR